MKIAKIHARQILDSRGNPTVEADAVLEDGAIGRASVPSGASTGINEALELRDGDPKIYHGKSVLKAVGNINTKISRLLTGEEATEQEKIDLAMITLDGTENKSNLGANAVLAVSLAVAKASAVSQKLPLFKYFSLLSQANYNPTLPVPMMNIINGGKHGGWGTDIQEFMIIPSGAGSFSEALRVGSEIFHTLEKVLEENGYPTLVGDEGGYAPKFQNGNSEALDLVSEAVLRAGYKLGKDIVLGIDGAASEFYENGVYDLKSEGLAKSSEELIAWYENLAKNYPIYSLEDGLDQEDWDGWVSLSGKLGQRMQIVGDDLLVTNVKYLEKAIQKKACNAILIKLNQIGTLTETIKAVETARTAGFKSVISHRSGETEDTTIAHLAVGLGTGQIKTGSLCRTDRVAKYNELLRIEEELGDGAKYPGREILK